MKRSLVYNLIVLSISCVTPTNKPLVISDTIFNRSEQGTQRVTRFYAGNCNCEYIESLNVAQTTLYGVEYQCTPNDGSKGGFAGSSVKQMSLEEIAERASFCN